MSAVVLFDLAQCERALGPLSGQFKLSALAECDSTNTQLMQRAETGVITGSVLVADLQTAGRGRRGRVWHSAPGESLVFSLLWRLPKGRMPDALSLAVGLGLVRAVAELGVVDPRVKWPNDIFCDGRKLAGVLIDLQPGQLQSAVIGVGINLGLPPGLPSDIAAVSVGLNTLLPQKLSRESLLALVLKHLARVLDQYEREGFAALREEWQTAHALQDRAVNVSGAEYLNGICSGVGERGELLVQTAEGLRRVLSGDVSLRPA